jgi:hypothetical protein
VIGCLARYGARGLQREIVRNPLGTADTTTGALLLNNDNVASGSGKHHGLGRRRDC